jgi:hypothetical protein
MSLAEKVRERLGTFDFE